MLSCLPSFNGLLFGGTPWNWMYVPNLKTVALPVREIIGGSKKIPAVPVYVTLPIPKLELLICISAAGIFAADALRLSSLKCLWRAPWILFISARVTFWPFRSSKVIDVGANRKRVCDFLLVRHSNFGPIDLALFQRYCRFSVLLTPPLFHLIFGVFPLDHIADVGSLRAGALSYSAVKYIFRSIPTYIYRYVITVRERYRRTDRRLNCGITALCLASRGKNYSLFQGGYVTPCVCLFVHLSVC